MFAGFEPRAKSLLLASNVALGDQLTKDPPVVARPLVDPRQAKVMTEHVLDDLPDRCAVWAAAANEDDDVSFKRIQSFRSTLFVHLLNEFREPVGVGSEVKLAVNPCDL